MRPTQDPRRHSLPFARWPSNDQHAWQVLFRKAEPLDDPGIYGHWAPPTIERHADVYGQWLAHLLAIRPDLLSADPAARMTLDTVQHYRTVLEQLVAPYTVLMRLDALLQIAKGLDPKRDWRFLRNLVVALRHTVSPERNRVARLVHSERLYRLGLKLIDRAQSVTGDRPQARLARAILVRDGLIIALLAARPLRLGNFTGLEIGRTFIPHGQAIRIDIPDVETKTRRPVEFDVPDSLVPAFQDYLTVHRNVLRRSNPAPGLWVTYRGEWISQQGLYTMITNRTRAAFGRAVNPHLFRHAAATSLAIDDPDNIHVATTLLGHATLVTTLKHYNLASTLTAGRVYQKHLRSLRRTVPGDRRPRRQLTTGPIDTLIINGASACHL